MAQNNVLGLRPYPRTLTSPRRETWFRWSTLQASSVGDKGKKVRGGTPPTTNADQVYTQAVEVRPLNMWEGRKFKISKKKLPPPH